MAESRSAEGIVGRREKPPFAEEGPGRCMIVLQVPDVNNGLFITR